MGGIYGCGWQKFYAKLGHGGRELGGDKRKKRSRGKRCQCPSSIIYIFFVPNCSILDIASLIRNPNSKLKIDNVTIHRLFLPKNIEVQFNKHRTTSKVDNLIVFGFLLDLVLVNNLY